VTLTLRFVIFCAAALVIALPFAGCSPGRAAETSDNRVVIEFWHSMSFAQGRAVNEMVDRFNRSQDRYYVRAIYQGHYNALNQKLIASLYARRNPALSQVYPSWTERFYRYGYLEPVERFLEEDPGFRAELDDFFEVMLAEATLISSRTGEKQLVTLPFNKSVYVVQANWTRMEQLGWKEPPKTREEFARLAEQLTVRAEGAARPTVHGFAVRGTIEDFTVQVMAADGGLVNEQTGEILVDSPKAIESLRFLTSLIRPEGGSPTGYVESGWLSNVLGSELIGMYIASTASFPFNDGAVGNKFIWRAFPVPSATPGKPARTLMQGTNVAIYQNLSPEERAAAWAFVKFMVSPEENARWAAATNYMPVRRATLEVPLFAEVMEKNVSYANSVGTLETATFEPRLIYWDSVRSVLDRRVQAVMLGRETPEAAMAAARREIEQIQRAAQ
jgi:multiple sugar transport system substrate-binding protein